MVHRWLYSALLAAMLVAGLIGGHALAENGVKHYACVANEAQPTQAWRYLPNGANSCPTGWRKIDWLDDGPTVTP